MSAEKLMRLVKLRKQLEKFPVTVHSKDVEKVLKTKTQEVAQRMLNARAKGIRFIRKNGRIIPIRGR